MPDLHSSTIFGRNDLRTMRTRSGRTYAVSFPPRTPRHELKQLLRSYLDPSRNTAIVSQGACPDCSKIIDYCAARFALDGGCRTVDGEAMYIPARLDAIRGSATRGCHVCSLLLDRLQEAEVPLGADGGPCSIKVTKLFDYRPSDRGIEVGMMQYAQTGSGYPIRLLEVRWCSQAEQGYDRILGPTSMSLTYISTASDKCFDLARAWLHKCVTNHASCAESHSHSRFTPTRLLKIEVIEGADTQGYSVRLCEGTREMRSDGDVPTYVAFSHRWGEATPYVLDSQSHVSLKTGIPISDLSPTFKDAIIVTAMLGYSWIWIDSMCIVQDSEKDWEAQAQLMGLVYSCCHLNIAALDASDCHAGLFSRRDHRSLTPYARRTSAGDVICISHRDIYQSGPERGGLKKPLQGILSRGWVVQEVLLSRRTLYYCKDMLFWECRSRLACERWLKFSDRIWVCDSPMGKVWFQELLSNHRASGRLNYNIWGHLIKRYSETRFTYWKDRYRC